MIITEQLSNIYGKTYAVKEVGLAVNKGQIYGFRLLKAMPKIKGADVPRHLLLFC